MDSAALQTHRHVDVGGLPLPAQGPAACLHLTSRFPGQTRPPQVQDTDKVGFFLLRPQPLVADTFAGTALGRYSQVYGQEGGLRQAALRI